MKKLAHPSEYHCLAAVSPDHQQLLFSGSTMKIYDSEVKHCIKSYRTVFNDFDWSPDEHDICMIRPDSRLRSEVVIAEWNGGLLNEKMRFQLKDRYGDMRPYYVEDGKHVIVKTMHKIQAFNLENGATEEIAHVDHTSFISHMVLSRDMIFYIENHGYRKGKDVHAVSLTQPDHAFHSELSAFLQLLGSKEDIEQYLYQFATGDDERVILISQGRETILHAFSTSNWAFTLQQKLLFPGMMVHMATSPDGKWLASTTMEIIESKTHYYLIVVDCKAMEPVYQQEAVSSGELIFTAHSDQLYFDSLDGIYILDVGVDFGPAA